ncbi:WXG100 family type VII secretion target [Nocardia puris]|uniref:ESAT-6-like protein n=1 Tax=Nocardia puris TaxID=208602 RepID=A0A366CTK4_9NOCA|nr:WXG100 family type VII secretion target [Nocardia puris]RBO79616.1 WXG100 family type VII secretion target [Nocardia puris]
MGSGSDSDDQLNVVPAEVSDTGQFVKLTAEELIAEVRSVDREIEQLMSSWTGDAANAYLQGWQETRSGALEVLEALGTLADLLGVSSRRYTATDTSNAQTWSSLDL